MLVLLQCIGILSYTDLFKATQMMLAYVFGDRDHPCDAAPLLFGEDQRSLRCDSVLSASQGVDYTIVYLQASGLCWICYVAFGPPFLATRQASDDACRSCVW